MTLSGKDCPGQGDIMPIGHVLRTSQSAGGSGQRDKATLAMTEQPDAFRASPCPDPTDPGTGVAVVIGDRHSSGVGNGILST